MKKIPLDNAVGEILAHDITEICLASHIKRRAYKRGHKIRKDDLDRLKRLGKLNVYVVDGQSDEVHEDEAAVTAAPLIAGEFISYDERPSEGKISFYAETKGLFRVDRDRLREINRLGVPSLPTIHDRFPVEKGKQVAAFRIIPLTCERNIMDRLLAILSRPLLSIQPYVRKSAAVLVTGSEVFSGAVEDGFTPKLTGKLERMGVKVVYSDILPDDFGRITEALRRALEQAEIVLITGGTSVDPDDVTVQAMAEAGIYFEGKGNPIQPGNNLTIGYAGNTAVCAVPAAALYYRATALDLFLPRLVCGERIPEEEIVDSGHGGLCHFCEKCVFPVCPFGRGY